MKATTTPACKTHHVGSVTLGITLITIGILLLLHLLFPVLTYQNIFKFWPVTLISLGIEVLIANHQSDHIPFEFDGWSVFFLFLILGFCMCIGILDCVLTHSFQCI